MRLRGESMPYMGSCGILGVSVQVGVACGVRGQVRAWGRLSCRPVATVPSWMTCRICQQGRSIGTGLGHEDRSEQAV